MRSMTNWDWRREVAPNLITALSHARFSIYFVYSRHDALTDNMMVWYEHRYSSRILKWNRCANCRRQPADPSLI